MSKKRILLHVFLCHCCLYANKVRWKWSIIGCGADIWVVVLQEIRYVFHWTVYHHVPVAAAWWCWTEHSGLWWTSSCCSRAYGSRYFQLMPFYRRSTHIHAELRVLYPCVAREPSGRTSYLWLVVVGLSFFHYTAKYGPVKADFANLLCHRALL